MSTLSTPSSAETRTLGSLFGLRRDELPRVLPFAVAYGLVLASLYILKPARNALFLHKLGVAELPYVLMLVALAGGISSATFARAAKQSSVERLVFRTLALLAAMLVGFRVLLGAEARWTYYAFYVFVNLYGLLATSLVWLLANAVFDAREARRVFGLIGTGGITGAIVGGLVTGRAVKLVGTLELILLSAALLVVALLLLRGVEVPAVRTPKKSKEPERGTFGELVRSPLLGKLALSSWLIAIVSVIIEIQFNDVVDRTISDTDAKTAFFGELFAYLSLFAFLFQLFVTPRILRTIGVGPALLFLPVSLAVGSGALLLAPGIAAAILLKIGDGGFRHSIHKSATEVAFLPVPSSVKSRVKLFLDTTVDTTGTGVGALVALGLGAVGVSYERLGLVSIALVAIAAVVGLGVRRAYVDAFRAALERREIELGDLRTELRDRSSAALLRPMLASTNERQVLYALDVLPLGAIGELEPTLAELTSHPSPDVRRRVILQLAHTKDPDVRARLEAHLVDPSHEVRIAAVFASARAHHPTHLARLRELLASEDPKLRLATVACIAEHGDLDARSLLDLPLVRALAEATGDGAEDARAVVAEAIGWLEDDALREVLKGLAHDPSPQVVDAVIGALGRARDRRFVPWLVTKLGDRTHRAHARAALVAFGPSVVGTLRQVMLEGDVALGLRRNIPRVLAEIPDQSAADALIDALSAKDPLLVELALSALGRLAERYPTIRFSRELLSPSVFASLRIAYALLEVERVLSPRPDGAVGAPGDREPAELLLRAVRERRQKALRQVFQLLGLRYGTRDIQSAWQALGHEDRAVRASAVELLENILSKRMRTYLLPLIDGSSADEVARHGRALFGDHIDSEVHALRWLIGSEDAWLEACAIYAAGAAGRTELAPMIALARRDPSPIVRETVELVEAELRANSA